MGNKDFTAKLFAYYKRTLELDDILSIKFEKTAEFLSKNKNSHKDSAVIYASDDFESFIKFLSNEKECNLSRFNVFVKFGDMENLENKGEIFSPFVVKIPAIDAHRQQLSLEEFIAQVKFIVCGETNHCIKEKNLEYPVIVFNPRLFTYDIEIKKELEQFDFSSYLNINRDGAKTYLSDIESKIETFIKENGLEEIIKDRKIKYCIANANYNAALIRFYEKVNGNIENTLLDKIFRENIAEQENDTQIFGVLQEICSSMEHIGSMDAGHSLKATQRISVLLSNFDKMDILPINGGPGTGKTSVLRAIFANYFVQASIQMAEHFIQKQCVVFDRMPFVCSSTNKQALTNIHEGFDRQLKDNVKTCANRETPYFYQRWIDIGITTETGEKMDFLVPNLRGVLTEEDKQNCLDMKMIFKTRQHVLDNEKIFLAQCKKISYLEIGEGQKIDSSLYCKIIKTFLTQIKQNAAKIKDKFEPYVESAKHIEKFREELLLQRDSKLSDTEDLEEKYKFIQHLLKHPLCVLRFFQVRESIKNIYTKNKNMKLDNTKSKRHITTLREKKSRHQKEIERLEKLIVIYDEKLPNSLWSSFVIKTPILNLLLLYIVKKICLPRWRSEKEDRKRCINEKERKIEEYEQEIERNEMAINKNREAMLRIRVKLHETIKRSNMLFVSKSILLKHKLHQQDSLLTCSYLALKEFRKENEKCDKSERLDNFYCALHIQEALLFASQYQVTTRKAESFLCPRCLKALKERNKSLVCEGCKAELFFNNCHRYITNDAARLMLEDRDFLKKVLNNRIYHHRETNRTYYAVLNEGDKKEFINILCAEDTPRSNNKSHLFASLFPIFPIVCVTCNSFGSFFGAEKNILDFLLIDEAGTISPNKAIILYNAKKVIFFGDTKQLKPIFAFTKTLERKWLRSFVGSNKSYIQTINNYFSCGDFINDSQSDSQQNINAKIKGADYDQQRFANNIMDIANNAVSIDPQHNRSSLRGDIWLKEHFRCGKKIANIANEMTYHGEMDLAWLEHEGRVEHIENKGKKENKHNMQEIEQIFEYIQENLVSWKDELGKTSLSNDEFCEKYVGIITPFTYQAVKLNEYFKENKHLIDLSKITKGTVHTFQGSERDIIVFSTVYGDESKNAQSFFFNKGESDLLNVAVTRAKKILIIFGRKELLKQKGLHSNFLFIS